MKNVFISVEEEFEKIIGYLKQQYTNTRKGMNLREKWKEFIYYYYY